MSRSPNCEPSDVEEDAVGPEEALRIGPGAKVFKSHEGLLVRPLKGKAAERPSDKIRWAMMHDNDGVLLLLPGETCDGARATLELRGESPDLCRHHDRIVSGQLSVRLQEGPRSEWLIVTIPPNGQTWDGVVLRRAWHFVNYVCKHFLRFAVRRFPTDRRPRFIYGPKTGPDTRLLMRASFPKGTPMLTAGRRLAPQMLRRKLAALTLVPPGLQVGTDDIMRQTGPILSSVQAGCYMGLAVDTAGRSKLVCFYVPSTGAVSPLDMANVANRLAHRQFKRR
jgi:hypothetical protein